MEHLKVMIFFRKTMLVALCAVCFQLPATAQRITRQYNNVSFSAALKDLNAAQDEYAINFVYDELEDFTVTKSIRNMSVPGAIRQLIGFYPIRMTQLDNVIIVECTRKTSSKMTGRVVGSHQRPIEYANVALLDVGDSTFITGGVTNEDGRFVIPCEAGKAIVRVSCVGYKTAYGVCNAGEMGEIALNVDTVNLSKVVVKGLRKTFEMTSERFVTQVKGTPLSEAGTANDVLAQVPGVYGGDGKFSVYGKGDALIYVNGRKLTDNTELERISSKDIASVVLNTNPGAKYDATTRAVITVKTVRKRGDGLSGDFTSMLRQGRYLSLSEGGNLNWRKGGLDVFGGLYYDLVQRYQHQKDNKTVWKDGDVWRMHSDIGIFPKSMASISSNIGFNYALNEHHSVGAKYNASFMPNSTSAWPTLQTVAKNGVEQENIRYDLKWNHRRAPAHYVNAYYRGETGKWSIAFDNDLVVRQDKAVQNIKELSSQSGESRVNSVNKADNLMFASKLVFSHPVGKGKVEAGGELVFTNRKQTYDNEEQVIASTDDHIKESKYAGFMSYEISLGKADFGAGLRYEHTTSDYYEHEVWMAGQSRKYDKLFPNAGISFPIGKAKLSVDYAMKTRRPSYRELSSNMQYDDAFTYEKGNPLLQPEIIHDITMTGIWRWIYFGVSCQHIDDAITNLIELQPGGDRPLNIFTNVNNPHLNKYTATLSLTPKFGPWSPRLSLTLMGQDFKMMHNGATLKMNNPLLFASWYNSFSLPNEYILSLDISGNTYGDMTIATLKPSWQLDFGVVKKLDRWTLQLKATDVFRTARNSMFTYGTSMLLNKWNYSDSQAVKLTVSYRFNTAGSKYKGTGAGNAEKDRLY